MIHGMITPPSTPSIDITPSASYKTIPKPSFSTRSMSIQENVQVLVRCRPRSEQEISIHNETCWNVNAQMGSIQLLTPKAQSTSTNTFYYDNVHVDVDNAQIYKTNIKALVQSAMMGYNGTVFAYGQTASGKTYTMMGTENEPGVIPRAIQDVFTYIEEDTYGREYLLRVSYMEIYNEQIKDLLNDQNTYPEIVEDKKGVHVRNLKEIKVKSAEEVLNCIKEGEKNRHISATDYNQRSSRSHTIFQLIIESRSKSMSGAKREIRLSQLNLIDLAGSESVASDKERRKEGAYINKSLLTLSTVISKLTSGKPSLHIPFRDSKLTRILQAALSGNARISVICTINPTVSSRVESLNTLKFAQRAKMIKTAAKMTKIHDDSELQNCLIKINELQTAMQEKDEIEAETRERLHNLLSLILTSSKVHDSDQDSLLSSLSEESSEDVRRSITISDVVARCEQGFAAQISAHQEQISAHQEELATLKQNLEVLQDALRVSQSSQDKQNEALAMRDAQISKLEHDLAAALEAKQLATKQTTYRSSRVPKHPVVIKPNLSSSSTVSTIAPVNNNAIDTINPIETSETILSTTPKIVLDVPSTETHMSTTTEADSPSTPEVSYFPLSVDIREDKEERLGQDVDESIKDEEPVKEQAVIYEKLENAIKDEVKLESEDEDENKVIMQTYVPYSNTVNQSLYPRSVLKTALSVMVVAFIVLFL